MRSHFLRAVQKTTQFDPSALFVGGKNGAWFDASDLSTLFTDTSGTTAVTSDGDRVALWKDKSGNNYNLTQATLGNRPTYRTSGGKSWLEFVASSNQFLQYSGTNIGVANAFIACNITSSSSSYAGLLTNFNDQTTLVDFAFTRLSINPYFDTGAANQGNGMGSFVRINQVATATFSYSTDSVCYTNATQINNSYSAVFPTGIKIGLDRSNSGRYLDGRMYGAIMVGTTLSDVLSTTTRDEVETWLSDKTVAVPF